MSSHPPPSNAPGTEASNLVALESHLLRRGPGRPRKFGRAPTAAEAARRELLEERLHQHVARDATVTATSRPVERKSTATLDVLMREIALEAASLGWDSKRAVVEGRREAERLATRRVSALEKIAQLALERARAGVEEGRVDPFDPRVRKIVDWFLACMRECASETLGSAAEPFLRRFDGLCEDWEQKVEP